MRENKFVGFCLAVGITVFSCAGAVLANEPPEFLKKITENGDLGRPKLGKGYRARLHPSGWVGETGIHIGFYPDYLGDKYPEFRGGKNTLSYFPHICLAISAHFGLSDTVTCRLAGRLASRHVAPVSARWVIRGAASKSSTFPDATSPSTSTFPPRMYARYCSSFCHTWQVSTWFTQDCSRPLAAILRRVRCGLKRGLFPKKGHR